jgi:hypothetical protein
MTEIATRYYSVAIDKSRFGLLQSNEQLILYCRGIRPVGLGVNRNWGKVAHFGFWILDIIT